MNIPPAEPETASTEGSDLIEALTMNLEACRRELLLYPAEHPRLASRLAQLREICVQLQELANGTLLLEVVEGKLVSNAAAVQSELEATQRLASCLRERMIRQIRISVGVLGSDLFHLAEILAADPDLSAAGKGQAVRHNPHVELRYFDSNFSDEIAEYGLREIISSQGILLDEDLEQQLDDPEWSGFAHEQLLAIADVLSNRTIQDRIRNLSGAFQTAEEDVSFSARLFRVLADDPRTDWNDQESLKKLLNTGLELLDKADRERKSRSALPTNLLADFNELSDELSAQLRFKMLKDFFPDEMSNDSPRSAEDLSFRGCDDPKAYAVKEAPLEVDPVDVPSLRKEFLESTERIRMAFELATVVGLMVEEGEVPANEEAMSRFGQLLRRDLAGEQLELESTRFLLDSVTSLPATFQAPWLAEILLSSVAPENVIDALSGDHEGIRSALMERSGTTPTAATADVAQELEIASNTLQLLLEQGGAFALEIITTILAKSSVSDRAREVWCGVFRGLAKDTAALHDLIERQGAALAQPATCQLLLYLPTAYVDSTLRKMNPRQLQELARGLPALPESIPILEMLLVAEARHVQLAAIRSLGRLTDPTSLQLLQDMLLSCNNSKADPEEITVICQALVQRPDSSGMRFLETVLQKKKALGLMSLWKPSVRSAARRQMILREGGSEL